VNTVNWRTARTAALGYIANTNGRLISGGLVQENAIVKYVPEAVKTLFLDNSTIPLPGMPKVVVEELGALGIDLYGSATGVPGWKQTIYGDLVFDGKNLADINAYAKQAAIDWYGWRLMSPELVYAGIEPWEPTGWEDCIEWTLKLIEQNPALPDSPTDDPYTKTQIRRGPWTDFNIGNLTAQQIKNPPSDSIYQPDYGSYVDGIQNEICILGIRYVTRGKLTAVGSGQSIRLSWYDLETRPDGCCPCPQPGSGSGNTGPTACCPYGTLASIAAAMQGAFGPNCETVTFGGTLNRTGNGFEGTLFGTGAYTAYTANVIVSCIAGVWRLDAVVILPSGRLVQFGFILGMLPGSGILSGAGNAQQIACANNNLVAAHVLYPCLSGGSGSSGSSGSGTAVVTDCGTLSQNIVIRFGGTLGALGSVNLTYNATNQEWESAPVTLPGCGVTVPTSILFFCGGLNQWNISFGTVFIASSTTTSFTGSTFGTCPGTGTAVVL
jgi:hypothetical protein